MLSTWLCVKLHGNTHSTFSSRLLSIDKAVVVRDVEGVIAHVWLPNDGPDDTANTIKLGRNGTNGPSQRNL